jgi:hypothetical protein
MGGAAPYHALIHFSGSAAMGMLLCGFFVAGQLICAPAIDPNSPDICYSNGWCDSSEYCAKPVGDCWGLGVCTPRPTIPPPCLEPVCGCTGVTYPNGWVAAMVGVSLRYPWACNAGDLNHDGHVDAADLDAFEVCMRGPDLICTDTCMEADTDYDYDVDLADYIVWQLMASPAAAVASVSHSDCSEASADLGECMVDDTIAILPSTGRLQILHDDVTYNCGMTGIAILVSVQGSLIEIEEIELLDVPAFCLCCYDVAATVVNLQPGAYTVRYCWEDQDMGWVDRCLDAPVVIP